MLIQRIIYTTFTNYRVSLCAHSSRETKRREVFVTKTYPTAHVTLISRIKGNVRSENKIVTIDVSVKVLLLYNNLFIINLHARVAWQRVTYRIDIGTFSLCFSALIILHYVQPFVVPFVVEDYFNFLLLKRARRHCERRALENSFVSLRFWRKKLKTVSVIVGALFSTNKGKIRFYDVTRIYVDIIRRL